jgi:diphthamide biosynthesis methyltransferase
MKQTAVDKFHDAVNDMIARRRPMTSNEVAKIWLECKEMEKEQIIKTSKISYMAGMEKPIFNASKVQEFAESFYELTYGSNK